MLCLVFCLIVNHLIAQDYALSLNGTTSKVVFPKPFNTAVKVFTVESDQNIILSSNSPIFIKPLNSSNYHDLRGGLRNSVTKFVNQKTGIVAFLGGSITEMSGWRDSISDYLKVRFPATAFTFINAGIPSMGSTPAAFRMERDVISKGKVDLLFEEAAVNDGTDGNNFSKTEQIRAMEGIARHAKTANPQMDVVFIYFADPGKNANYANNTIPDVIINHDLVAKAYDIPSINLAKEVADRIKNGEFEWTRDFESLHPSPFGQSIYFRSMRCFLDSAWKAPVLANDTMVSTTLPDKIDLFCYDTGYLVDITKAEASTGWTINQNWAPTDGKSTRNNYTKVSMLIGETPESILTFKFNGKAVGISPACGPNAGIVLSSIDDGPWLSNDLFTAWSQYLYLPWYTTLYSKLPEGNHTLRLKMSARKNASSIGTAAIIRYFYVSGTTIPSAINSQINDNLINISRTSNGETLIRVNSDKEFSYKVFNANGIECTQNSNCINNDVLHIPVSEVYIVEIKIGDQRYVKKIIL